MYNIYIQFSLVPYTGSDMAALRAWMYSSTHFLGRKRYRVSWARHQRRPLSRNWAGIHSRTVPPSGPRWFPITSCQGPSTLA